MLRNLIIVIYRDYSIYIYIYLIFICIYNVLVVFFVIVTIFHHLSYRYLLPSMYFLTIGIYYSSVTCLHNTHQWTATVVVVETSLLSNLYRSIHVYIYSIECPKPGVLDRTRGPHTAHYVQLRHFIYFSPSSASTEGEYGILEPEFHDGGHCQSALRRQCVLFYFHPQYHYQGRR